jgi:hypothetical protein
MPDSLPPETLAWLRQSAALDGAVVSQTLLNLLERVEALEKKHETQRLATLEWGEDVNRLMRWIDDHLKRIMALEQRPIPGTVELAAPTPEAAPVATDEELGEVAADHSPAATEMVPSADPLVAEDELVRCYAQAVEQALQAGSGINGAAAAGLRALHDLGRQHGAAAAQPAPPVAPAGGLVERVGEAMERHYVIGDIEGSWDAQSRAAIREVAAWMNDHEHAFHAAYWLELEVDRA